MSAPLRLGGFVVVLALVFAAALAAGSVLGPDRAGAGPGEPMAGGHGGGAMADPVRGLAVSDDGLTLALDRAGRRLAFRILDEEGRPVREFEVEHERRMHVIVVRRDTAVFEHVHPQLGADGVWRVPLSLREPGAYRVFADFVHGGAARTLAADLTVDGAADYEPLPPASTTADAGDGYSVALDAQGPDLSFTVTRDGEPVETEPYLGAGGHLVALREGDLAFLHVHPEEGVRFETTFPTAGRYRLFLQFRHAGEVRTAAFTHEVAR